jgi:hypothetical protein
MRPRALPALEGKLYPVFVLPVLRRTAGAHSRTHSKRAQASQPVPHLTHGNRPYVALRHRHGKEVWQSEERAPAACHHEEWRPQRPEPPLLRRGTRASQNSRAHWSSCSVQGQSPRAQLPEPSRAGWQWTWQTGRWRPGGAGGFRGGEGRRTASTSLAGSALGTSSRISAALKTFFPHQLMTRCSALLNLFQQKSVTERDEAHAQQHGRRQAKSQGQTQTNASHTRHLFHQNRFTERDGGKGPPAGNKARCNRTNTPHSKAMQRKAKPNQTPQTHTWGARQA